MTEVDRRHWRVKELNMGPNKVAKHIDLRILRGKSFCLNVWTEAYES
jgi:hypothetical protein